MGYNDMVLTSKFDQWMGAFPYDETSAYGVLVLGAATAALGGAQQTIVKSPQEAMGVPTKEANAGGIRATKQAIGMMTNQKLGIEVPGIEEEMDLITQEVNAIINTVYDMGEGDLAIGVVRAFESGVLDVPFAPSVRNIGLAMPVRDDRGALRFLDFGNLPIPEKIKKIHRKKLDARAKKYGKPVDFNRVIEDIYGISKGYLVQ